MFKWVDDFLNQITMYRLTLYSLIVLVLVAAGLGWAGMLDSGPGWILLSALFITAVCWVVNVIFARIYRAPINVESVYITALILALIIAPPHGWIDANYWSLAVWASVWAMASKYILAIKGKHIFNPAAFGVTITALLMGQSAMWWIGTPSMLPFVAIAGYLIVRKILRWDLVVSYWIVALLAIVLPHMSDMTAAWSTLSHAVLYSPLIFFGTIMLTEPLTSPPTPRLRMGYGALTGVLFAPWVHLGNFYFTPEITLLVGNIFAYIVSPRAKLILKLKERRQIGPDTYDLVFTGRRGMKFVPGQYMEWTLKHPHPDGRGNRRYFTIASAPGEQDIRIGVKSPSPKSTFKRELLALRPGDKIVASQLAGDFVLPKGNKSKLVWIAGGIGITPFRSMAMDLIFEGRKREIALFYSNRTVNDIAYKEVFDRAGREIGLKTIYALTDASAVPQDWQGERGYITPELIQKRVPDYSERLFYISGPRQMVLDFKRSLRELGVPKSQVKTDYFPGFV